MKNYKVLWFDDEHETLELISEKAHENGLELKGFNNAKDGISELDSNFANYDAVLVDGLFFDRPDQEVVGSGGTAFGKVAMFLETQKIKGNLIPWFILSGQPSFVKQKNDILSLYREYASCNGKVYDKNDDNDIDSLFLDIKTEIENVDKIRVRIKYSEAFDAIGDNYLSPDDEENLVEVLLAFEKNTWTINSFTPLRKIIEAIYKSIHNYDDWLIPLGCLRYDNGKVNFKYCELRLNGKPIREHGSSRILYEASDVMLPEHLGNSIGSITKICSSASHTGEQVLTRYSLGTVVYFVIDLLIWYKRFIDENYL